MKSMGENLSSQEVEKMMEQADSDGDGLVSFDEFAIMMNKWEQDRETEGITDYFEHIIYYSLFTLVLLRNENNVNKLFITTEQLFQLSNFK